MIFNLRIFKKLIKEAYKGILHWYNRECHYSATIIDTNELTKERAILETLRAVELG